MKLREKLFLLMMMTVLGLAFVFNSLILDVLSKQYKQEKIDLANDSVNKVLLSFSYNEDAISSYVYESCRGENVATYLSGAYRNPSIPLEKILKLISANNKAILTGVFISHGGEIYTDGTEKSHKLVQMMDEGDFVSTGDVQWIYTNNGNIFLKRRIYSSFPREEVGYGVFEIDGDYLRSITGIDSIQPGHTCIVDRYGNMRLADGDADLSFFQEIIDGLREGKALSAKMEIAGECYYAITAINQVKYESVIHMVTEKDLLEPYYRVEHITNGITYFILAIAAVVSLLVSHAFTRKFRILQQQVNDITTSEERLTKIVIGRRADEIGELAKDINKLLARIDNLYEANLLESQAKQNTRYEMLEWQYRALQSQISPHFLCNILSSISMLAAVGDYREVQSISTNASKYLRRNLNCGTNKNNTIAEEITISKEYVTLASELSAVPIVIDVVCPADLQKARIPCYLLQPLVENCIKHGMPPRNADEFQILITVEHSTSDTIRITVSDNGQGFESELIENFSNRTVEVDVPRGKINFGLEGIVKRLYLQYPGNHRINLSNLPDGGSAVDIEIPLKLG